MLHGHRGVLTGKKVLGTSTHPQSGDKCMVMEFAQQGSLDHVLSASAEQDVHVSNLVRVRAGERLPKPDNCPDELYAIMTKCWCERPQDRPSMPEIHAMLQTVFAEMFKTSECVICLEKAAVVALIPCGHRCACEGCAPSLRNRPMCRQPVREAKRIFL